MSQGKRDSECKQPKNETRSDQLSGDVNDLSKEATSTSSSRTTTISPSSQLKPSASLAQTDKTVQSLSKKATSTSSSRTTATSFSSLLKLTSSLAQARMTEQRREFSFEYTQCPPSGTRTGGGKSKEGGKRKGKKGW